ncbi:MAG: hypothetical protein JRN43_06810 [Nitrososphaerota archaeon]|nr:hypothetical protein [Nitrososphaerota archaeon]
MQTTTVQVSETTHRKLGQMKLDLRAKSIDEVLNVLLDEAEKGKKAK